MLSLRRILYGNVFVGGSCLDAFVILLADPGVLSVRNGVFWGYIFTVLFIFIYKTGLNIHVCDFFVVGVVTLTLVAVSVLTDV